ncbi:DNA recombination protein RmuC [Thermomonas paludicola]|uniref:DNA recombination protein RmuC n=1 Tax=Thermomonas paludicola TaxID=2884874 RepID=UPI002114EF8E|nr:DNA recombination protein RmuC [Thermomonas paludicola]
MDTNTLLLLAILLAALVIVALLLLRKPDQRAEQAIREERDRLVVELEGERNARQAAAAAAARLTERVLALEKSEQELTGVRDAMRHEQAAASELRATVAATSTALQQTEQRLGRAEAERDALRQELEQLRHAYAEESARLSHSERSNTEMQAFLANAQERLSGVFADLAGKAFDERTQQAALQSKGDLEMLLKPFSDQLAGFRQRVDVLHGDESRERATLVGKIDELKTLNQHMAQRAHELTTALRGNAKVRGDWGELMLESVLQGSGLVEGAHYQRQKSSTTDEGERLQPDIVVNLPDDRRIVVDSKVNLIAWQEAMNAATPAEQEEALRRHAVGLRQHVKDLGEKNYPKAIGERALEITIAFVPIEGALSAALGFDAALQTFAFDQKVVFASPNTLMALLRVVDRLWTRDKIQREASEIARTGGLVLDSLTNFLADFDNVGRRLDEARTAFNGARGKLSESNNALIPRARRLVQLGAKGKKALPAELQGDAEDSVGEMAALQAPADG